MTNAQKKFFTAELLRWHETANTRSLPWKEEKDPYRIWLSEIILQQTRAQQGLPYYLAFTEAYPDVHKMAAAPEEEVYRIWQGLGYYNRCRNMLATARFISSELDGNFPGSYSEILSLKGIGPYTAAAIASFAFGLPHAVLDGNVYRMLSRFFGIETPIDSTAGKQQFRSLAQELLYTKDSAAWNQAIMDFGATICTPAAPRCNECLFRTKCFAYKNDLIGVLPVKAKKVTVKKRYFHYLLLMADDKVWIQKRPEGDIWQNLHEFYLIEDDKVLGAAELVKHTDFPLPGFKQQKLVYEGNFSQRLTHRIIESHFYSIRLDAPIQMPADRGKWQSATALKNLALPKTLVSFLEKKLYF